MCTNGSSASRTTSTSRTHGTSPLATVCASAVDPLEIAVALEVAGISHAVATESLQPRRRLLHRSLLVDAAAPSAGDLRRGRICHARETAAIWHAGVLYALPALMLLALTSAFELSLARWVLPFAISWGWGLGQVTAFIGYRMQVGANAKHEPTVMARVIAAAALATVVISTIAALLLRWRRHCSRRRFRPRRTYMVASAILLMRAEEKWLALLLAPGAVSSVVVLAMSDSSRLHPRARRRHDRRLVRCRRVSSGSPRTSFVPADTTGSCDTTSSSHRGTCSTESSADWLCPIVVIQVGDASTRQRLRPDAPACSAAGDARRDGVAVAHVPHRASPG